MTELVNVMIGFAQLTDAVRENAAVRDSEESRAVLTRACRIYEAASAEDREQLRKLLARYPDSPLAPEARQALERVTSRNSLDP